MTATALKYNVGKYDRRIRITVSLIVIMLGFYYQSLWAVIGIFPLVTGIIGICPLYKYLGLSTCHSIVDMENN